MSEIKKILIIEDDVEISRALGEAITSMGHEIAFASNGKEGMDRLVNSSSLPDLILLDLFLPIMTGSEFRLRQLQIPYLAVIPTVAMSADCCVKQRCTPLHLKKYLKKPFDLNDIAQIIDSLN